MIEILQIHELSLADVATATRLMKLNNPGGVRISPAAWPGKITARGARMYEQFTKYADGVGAMLAILAKYYDEERSRTIEKIVYRYGDTHVDITAYVNAVCVGCGIRARQEFPWRRETLHLIVSEMCRYENKGRNPMIHPDLFAYVWLKF